MATVYLYYFCLPDAQNNLHMKKNIAHLQTVPNKINETAALIQVYRIFKHII